MCNEWKLFRSADGMPKAKKKRWRKNDKMKTIRWTFFYHLLRLVFDEGNYMLYYVRRCGTELHKNIRRVDNLDLDSCKLVKEWNLWLRVSSLVRFYKSRFWFFSENFLKNFWIKFLKNFWKICESRDFLLPAIQKWMKTGCFSAVFKLFCCYLQTFCVVFLEFWRISKTFRNFSESFLKKFWKFSEIFLKKLWMQRFSAASDSKMNEKSGGKLAVLLLFSNFLRCFSRILTNFRIFSEIFQNCFRIFSEIFQKFLKNFWKNSEIFLKNLWIQRFSAANHSKMKETSCFAAVFKVFS